MLDITILFNPGLYRRICLKNNKIYIGESSNVLSRLGRHVDNLENNRHDCDSLQNDLNKYGKKAFKFESLLIGIQYNNQKVRKLEEFKILQTISKSKLYNQKVFNRTFYVKKCCYKRQNVC